MNKLNEANLNRFKINLSTINQFVFRSKHNSGLKRNIFKFPIKGGVSQGSKYFTNDMSMTYHTLTYLLNDKAFLSIDENPQEAWKDSCTPI